MNWRKYFTPTILERGKRYQRDGFVDDLKKVGDKYTAVVYGSNRYRVSITIKNGVVKINLASVSLVGKEEFKGYGVLVSLGAGHTLNGLSALKNAVALVLKEGGAVAVFIFDFKA